MKLSSAPLLPAASLSWNQLSLCVYFTLSIQGLTINIGGGIEKNKYMCGGLLHCNSIINLDFYNNCLKFIARMISDWLCTLTMHTINLYNFNLGSS